MLRDSVKIWFRDYFESVWWPLLCFSFFLWGSVDMAGDEVHGLGAVVLLWTVVTGFWTIARIFKMMDEAGHVSTVRR